MSQITTRTVPLRVHDQLVREGLHPVLARVCAARGIIRRGELQDALSGLIPPSDLMNAERAAALLADAITAGKRMLIVADYDCDGATACAVGMRALSAFGANVGFLVPNRFEFGYGLTPEIVALAAQSKPELLITVDNGIASVEGVAAAGRLGIDVIVTDHHLPGAELPRAAAIVNPPARLRVSEQEPRGRRRDVLCDACPARRAAQAWSLCRQGGAESGRYARSGRPGHGRRRRPARFQQSRPGDAGPETHPRRPHAGRRARALCRCRPRSFARERVRSRISARAAVERRRAPVRHEPGD